MSRWVRGVEEGIELVAGEDEHFLEVFAQFGFVFVLFVHFAHEPRSVNFLDVYVVKFWQVLLQLWFRVGLVALEC